MQGQSRVRGSACLGSDLELCSFPGACFSSAAHVGIENDSHLGVPEGLGATAVERTASLYHE